MIEQEGAGVVVALHAAAPGSLSLATNLRSGKPAESGPALRAYGIGAQILAALGIHDMILLSNTRHAPVGLSAYGLAIVEERCISGLGETNLAHVLIAEARFYAHLNDMLLEGARARDRGGGPQP